MEAEGTLEGAPEPHNSVNDVLFDFQPEELLQSIISAVS